MISERSNFPYKDYKDYISSFMHNLRENPKDYDIKEDDLLLNGYTVLTETYGLSEEPFNWVQEYIMDDFFNERIQSQVNTKSEKHYWEFDFDFIDGDNVYKGKGWGGSFDGYHFYLKDEDFMKINFPEIPHEIPSYVKIIDELRNFEDFRYKSKEELLKLVNSLKIGDTIKLENGKIITVIDVNNGNVTITD